MLPEFIESIGVNAAWINLAIWVSVLVDIWINLKLRDDLKRFKE